MSDREIYLNLRKIYGPLIVAHNTPMMDNSKSPFMDHFKFAYFFTGLFISSFMVFRFLKK
jgi:hypothetical protein